MKNVLRALAATAAVGVLVVTGTPATAGAGPADGRDRPDRSGLQRGLDEIVDAGAVGVLAEVRDGRGVWRGTSGVARLGTRREVPARARFRAGSITKTFVAATVLQLVERGRLRLDDPVERWLPGVVPGADRITVRHLLGQTSGLFDFLRTLTLPPAPEFLAERHRTWTADELVARAVANQPAPMPPPGEDWAYSNTNYALLGEVVEAVTGRPYARVVERRVLRPLHLPGTSLPGTSERIPGRHPHGYVRIRTADGTRLVDVTRMNPSVMGAGGEIISTTADLNRFFAALLDGRVVSRALLRQMLTPSVPDGPYGLGVFVRETTCGVTVYGHNGDALAYQSWSYATRDGRRQVTLALTPDHSADLDDVVEAYLDRVFCG